MNSDAEYPLKYSKEKYVMLRRSVFDAMQTRIAELEDERVVVPKGWDEVNYTEEKPQEKTPVKKKKSVKKKTPKTNVV